jgi:protein-S-isoprenylcysteine O-methyltransferase Ste14
MLFWKALFAFLVLPGIVAFAAPLLWLKPAAASLALPGAVLVAAGSILLLWCVREFYVSGRGTLAPWSPPQALVVTGLYRYSRNPMYVAVVVILWGWAAGYRSFGLAIYSLAVMVAFHLRIVFGEEPWLARRYGEQWERYKASVPRWFWTSFGP